MFPWLSAGCLSVLSVL